jgi:hypothetical protein
MYADTGANNKGANMDVKVTPLVKVKDEENGRTWYAITWRGNIYQFADYASAVKFWAELQYEVLYGVLKPQVSFID